jgi:hypothetical protein
MDNPMLLEKKNERIHSSLHITHHMLLEKKIKEFIVHCLDHAVDVFFSWCSFICFLILEWLAFSYIVLALCSWVPQFSDTNLDANDFLTKIMNKDPEGYGI